MPIFKGVKREGCVASNIADHDRWGLVNPKWQGVWGIHTPSGRECLLLTTHPLNQGEINEIEYAIDEAFARAGRAALQQSGVEEE